MRIFPTHLFNPTYVAAGLRDQAISGGQALSGDESMEEIEYGGRWEIEYSGITLNTPEKIRVWQAWLGWLDGGVTDVLVPLVTISTAPRASLGRTPQPVPGIVADDPTFPFNVEYATPVIEAALLANAVAGARSIQIGIIKGGAIKGGETFRINRRAYRIIRQIAEDTYAIRPALRESVFMEYDEPDFDWPYVRCRLNPTGDEHLSVQNGTVATPKISFIEKMPDGTGDYDDDDQSYEPPAPPDPPGTYRVKWMLQLLGGDGGRIGHPGLGFWVNPELCDDLFGATGSACYTAPDPDYGAFLAGSMYEHTDGELHVPVDDLHSAQYVEVRFQVGTGTTECPASGERLENMRLLIKKPGWPQYRACLVNPDRRQFHRRTGRDNGHLLVCRQRLPGQLLLLHACQLWQ